MIESKYMDVWKKIDKSYLVKDFILVERLDLPEFKTAGGIVLAETTNHDSLEFQKDKPMACLILEAGPGCEYVKPGGVIMLAQFSARFYSKYLHTNIQEMNYIGIASEEQVQKYYPTIEEYEREMHLINEGIAGRREAKEKEETQG